MRGSGPLHRRPAVPLPRRGRNDAPLTIRELIVGFGGERRAISRVWRTLSAIGPPEERGLRQWGHDQSNTHAQTTLPPAQPCRVG